MRKQILLLFIIIFSKSIFSQIKVEFDVVPIVENQKFNLNSQSRIGGTTRSQLHIKLPANTVSWIYMLTTSNSNTSSVLNLMPQVVNLIDQTGLTSSLLNSLTYPTGTSKINAYVFQENQLSGFVNNLQFSYFPSISRTAFNSGPVKVDYPFNKGNFYIGLDNPDPLYGINIQLDVVALVSKNTSSQNPNTNISKTGLQTILETIQANLNKSKNINSVNSIPDNSSSNQNNNTLIIRNPQAVNYGSMGWYAYERGDISSCIEYSKKSISIQSLFFVKANLGLCYLIQSNDYKAVESYMEGLEIIVNESNSINQINEAINDIQNAKNKYKLSSTADDIISLLKKKL